MRAGQLRHRITVQSRSDGADELNQPLTTWVDVVTLWAEVEQLSGRELMAASAERAENIARVTVRWRPDLLPNMRIVYGAALFDITDISDVEGRFKQLELMCKAGLSDG